MEKKERKGLALGAAIGAIAGVVTGILFAPKSGKETRADIKDGATAASERVQEEAKKIQSETKDVLAKVEKKATEATGTVSEKAKKHAGDLKHNLDNVTTVAKSLKSGKASDKDLNSAIKQLKLAKESVVTFMKK